MNFFDLVVCLVLALAVWNGWRKGCVVQLCGLAGLVIAVWLAARFGPEVGHFLKFEGQVAAPGGFVIVLLVALCAAAIVGRAIRKLLRFAGLGFVDVVAGIAVAVVKYVLLLSVLFSAFDRLNADFRFIEPQTLEQSKTYRPVLRVAEWVFPFVERMQAEASERFSAMRDMESDAFADRPSDGETI